MSDPTEIRKCPLCGRKFAGRASLFSVSDGVLEFCNDSAGCRRTAYEYLKVAEGFVPEESRPAFRAMLRREEAPV